MAEKTEIIILSAAVAPIKGWQVLWAFSKKQLDMVLHDVDRQEIARPHEFIMSKAVWQNDLLPVVSLEHYFGLAKNTNKLINKYAILKDTVERDGANQIVRLIVETNGNVRVREANFSETRVTATFLPLHQEDVLGVYKLDNQQLIVLPNIRKIYHNIMQQEIFTGQ